MDKKLRETTYLCVKIMNSKRQMYCKGETWSPGTNFVTWCLTSLIDLLSLYVLFSQYRSCDNTLENCFFQISSCSRAYVCRHKNTKCQVPLGPLLGKQTIQAKEVYTSQSSATRKPGGGRLLNKCLFEDAPPRGPTSYPLYTIFHEKGTPSCEACGETWNFPG